MVLVLCVTAFCIAMGLREEVNVWVGTGAAATLSVLLLAGMGRLKTGPTARSPSWSGLAMGVAAGLAMAVATWLLYPVSIELLPAIEGEVETLYALLRQPPGPIRAFPLLLFVVAAEELVWRGLAIDLFSNVTGPWPAAVASALLYVLPQIAFRSPLLMLVALACGLVWGALRVYSKGLAAPFAAHVVWNILVFVAYPVA